MPGMDFATNQNVSYYENKRTSPSLLEIMSQIIAFTYIYTLCYVMKNFYVHYNKVDIFRQYS